MTQTKYVRVPNQNPVYEVCSWNNDLPVVMKQDSLTKLNNWQAASFEEYWQAKFSNADPAFQKLANDVLQTRKNYIDMFDTLTYLVADPLLPENLKIMIMVLIKRIDDENRIEGDKP